MWGAIAKGIGGAIVGEVAVALALNTSAFDKDVSKNVKNTEKAYNNAFNGIGNAGSAMFSKLGKAALALVSVGAIVKFSKQALQLGSDLQEVQNVVDVTFGSMSSAVNDYAQNAITTAGLSETVAKRYMGTFGAMNNQFGFTTEQSYEMAKAITQLTGDVASFYNLSTDEAYTKLKSIWTGETETLKEIGVVMTQNALDQYALANGYGKTTAKMTEQEKVALRYAFVQDKLRLASGDFVRTQDSWANQTRVLTLRWQQFMATVGQGLINVLTPLVKMLNVLMGKLQSFANAFKNFTSSLFGDANANASGGTSSTLTNINDGLSGIGTTATDTADSVSSAAKKMKRSLGSMDELNVLNTSKDSDSGSSGGISDQILGASGIGGLGDTDVSGGISETGGALSKLADKVKELIKPLQEIDFTNLKNGLDKVKKSLEPITKKLGEGLEWLWDEILVPVATWTIEDAIPSFLNATAGALDFFNGVMDYAKPYLQFFWDEFLKPIANWTGGVIVDVLDGIGNGLSKVGDWLSEHAPTLKEVKEDLGPFANLLKQVSEFLGKILGLGWKVFSTVLEKLWENALKPIWENLLQPLLTNFWSKLSGLASILGGIFEACNKIMEGDWEGAGNAIVEGLTDGIEEIWNGSWVKQKVYDPIVGWWEEENPVLSISNKFETTKQDVSNWWSNVKTWWGEKKLSVKNKFETTKTDITNWWNNVKAWWGEKKLSVKNKFETTKSTVNGWWNNVKAWWGEKSLSLKIKIGEVIGSVKSWFNTNLIKPLNKKLPSFIPKIPYLAQGGWVAANSPQLAVVGDNKREGEIIAPESKIRDQVKQAITEMGGTGGKQQLEITIYHKYEDGKTIIQKVNQAQIDAGEVLLLT